MPKDETPENTKRIEACAARFDTPDDYGDRIMPGAFTESLERIKTLPITMRGDVVGTWDDFKQTDEGLIVSGYLFDDVDVEALSRSISIGFVPMSKTVNTTGASLSHKYTKVEITEINLCRTPILPGAKVTMVEGESLEGGNQKSALNEDDPLPLINDVMVSMKVAGISTLSPHAVAMRYSEQVATLLTAALMLAWTEHLAKSKDIGQTERQARKSFVETCKTISQP